MEENVIFKNPQNVQPVSSMPSSLPSEQPPPSDARRSSSSIAKKIIKLILGILVVGIIGAVAYVFFLPKQEERSVGEKVTLVYWGLWEDPNVMQPIISDFMEQNPNIKVTYAQQDIEQYRERILARIENETGPDVFWFHNTWWEMLSSVLAPVPADVITKSDFDKLYYKVANQDLIKNGAIYGIPLEIDTLSLYVNTDLFNAASLSPPTNWIDFANISRELTVKDEQGNIKIAGAAVGTFDNITHAGDLISLFFVQNGSNLYNLSETQQAADALRFYTSFALGDKVWDETLEESLTAFVKGKLGMYFGYLRDFPTIKAANPNVNFEAHPVPHLPEQDITIASYWAQGVSVKSKQQKEAMLFLKFLSQKETQPARIEAENAVSTFFASNTADNGLNDKANEHLRNAINSILSGVSTDTAIDTLSEAVLQVLEQYSAKKKAL